MGTTPQPIQTLLHTATTDVSDILARARFLGRIRSALLDILPPSAATQFQVAAYEQYRLRLHVANAAWATRLRYMERQIARALAQRMQLQIEAVQIRVRPVNLGPYNKATTPRRLSSSTRRHLQRTASHVADQDLSQALQRLAQAASKS